MGHHRSTDQHERSVEHINALEVKAVQLALQALIPSKSKIRIQLLIDNSTTIAYLNHKGGTHSKTLCAIAVEIWTWCLEREISIHAKHIPEIYNTVADAESRMQLDLSDWRLKPSIFAVLQQTWGSFDVDLFAARPTNKKLPRFYSFQPDPEAEAVYRCGDSKLVQAIIGPSLARTI